MPDPSTPPGDDLRIAPSAHDAAADTTGARRDSEGDPKTPAPGEGAKGPTPPKPEPGGPEHGG